LGSAESELIIALSQPGDDANEMTTKHDTASERPRTKSEFSVGWNDFAIERVRVIDGIRIPEIVHAAAGSTSESESTEELETEKRKERNKTSRM
jgi:hypothetical protein